MTAIEMAMICRTQPDALDWAYYTASQVGDPEWRLNYHPAWAVICRYADVRSRHMWRDLTPENWDAIIYRLQQDTL